MNGLANTIIGTVPAAQELRKVKGFDPLKYLHKAMTADGGEVLTLELRYKKLWFRLACPNGRMLLKPLQLTEQLAIFEAMVFQSRDEQEPLARITSTATRSESPDGHYVEAAQDRALDEALENAGFGIQLCDFVKNAGRVGFGSAVTPPQPGDAETDTESLPAQAVTAEPERVPEAVSESAKQTVPKKEPQVTASLFDSAEPTAVTVPAPLHEAKAEQPVNEVVAQPESKVVQPENEAAEAVAAPSALDQLMANTHQNVVQFPTPIAASESAAPAQELDPLPVNTADAGKSAYTPDMSVEEIQSRMTLDEAKGVVVTSGLCAGMTLERVAKERPANLRFYVFSEATNSVLKAAAKLVLDDMNLAKAS